MSVDDAVDKIYPLLANQSEDERARVESVLEDLWADAHDEGYSVGYDCGYESGYYSAQQYDAD
jgi:hypothetical protein